MKTPFPSAHESTVDTYVTGPTPPESSRAQAALVSDERVMDAFAASAKAERPRQNQRRREESRRSAGEVLLPLDVRQEPCSSNEQGRPSGEVVQRADEETGYGRRQVRIGLWPRETVGGGQMGLRPRGRMGLRP